MKKEKDWEVIIEKIGLKTGLKRMLLERLSRLEPLEKPERLWKKFVEIWIKRLLLIMTVSAGVLIIFAVFNQQELVLQEGNRLVRPGYNGTEQEVRIRAGVELQENVEDIFLNIEPEKYTFEEFEAVTGKALSNLENDILGGNTSLEEVTENLYLPGQIEDTPVEILWESDNEEIISREGIVNRQAAGEDGTFVVLTAKFTYEEYKISHLINVYVKPEELSEPMRLQKKLLDEIESAFKQSEFEEEISLPSEIEGKQVIYEEEKQTMAGAVPFFFLMGILIWIIAVKEEIEKQEKARERQLFMDYPELISQFTLLLSAGLTVGGAWKRLVDQYEKHRKKDGRKRRYVYEEMTITWWEMQNGISEAEAIWRFGNRIKLTPYLKFSALLSQNLRKGSKGLVGLLKTEAGLAQEERKETAKQLGEEAGTKLLFPMLMMFGIVLIMILVPAFMSF